MREALRSRWFPAALGLAGAAALLWSNWLGWGLVVRDGRTAPVVGADVLPALVFQVALAVLGAGLVLAPWPESSRVGAILFAPAGASAAWLGLTGLKSYERYTWCRGSENLCPGAEGRLIGAIAGVMLLAAAGIMVWQSWPWRKARVPEGATGEGAGS